MSGIAEAFEAERARLVRLAYGQLGSLAEAEDVVQDAWLRLERAGAGEIRDLPAWLTTTVSRLALDTLRSARVQRQSYIGPWLPEPLVGDEYADPADRVTLDESVGMALMVVLESLSERERVAFVLHDVFGAPFVDVAEVLGVSPDSARQLASRARREVEARRPRFPADREQQREIVSAFIEAVAEGDTDRLVGLLHPAAVMRTDGGGKVVAARKPVEGAARIAKVAQELARKGADPSTLRLVDVNGMPGMVVRGWDGLYNVASFTIDDGRVVAIDVWRNPDKLHGVEDA
jgi:RNA polymerase sigma-70 factor (ECF subfamily)